MGSSSRVLLFSFAIAVIGVHAGPFASIGPPNVTWVATGVPANEVFYIDDDVALWPAESFDGPRISGYFYATNTTWGPMPLACPPNPYSPNPEIGISSFHRGAPNTLLYVCPPVSGVVSVVQIDARTGYSESATPLSMPGTLQSVVVARPSGTLCALSSEGWVGCVLNYSVVVLNTVGIPSIESPQMFVYGDTIALLLLRENSVVEAWRGSDLTVVGLLHLPNVTLFAPTPSVANPFPEPPYLVLTLAPSISTALFVNVSLIAVDLSAPETWGTAVVEEVPAEYIFSRNFNPSFAYPPTEDGCVASFLATTYFMTTNGGGSPHRAQANVHVWNVGCKKSPVSNPSTTIFDLPPFTNFCALEAATPTVIDNRLVTMVQYRLLQKWGVCADNMTTSMISITNTTAGESLNTLLPLGTFYSMPQLVGKDKITLQAGTDLELFSAPLSSTLLRGGTLVAPIWLSPIYVANEYGAIDQSQGCLIVLPLPTGPLTCVALSF